MAIGTAEAEWNGDLAHGAGQTRLGSGACPCDFRSRMGDGKDAGPEELLGAAAAFEACARSAKSHPPYRAPCREWTSV